MEDIKLPKDIKIEPKFKFPAKALLKAEPTVVIKKSVLWQTLSIILMVALALSVWTGGFSKVTDLLTGGAVTEEQQNTEPQQQQTAPPTIGVLGTFNEVSGDVYKEDGKPVVTLFSTSWCPHCTWIKETFDKFVKDEMAQGKIVAYHWELDTGDNTLTTEVETAVPDKYLQIYQTFNPDGSIPTFVFGNKYYRVGNGYERENNTAKEAAEFRQIIDTLLA